MGWVIALAASAAWLVTLRYLIAAWRYIACLAYCWSVLSDWAQNTLLEAAACDEDRESARDRWKKKIDEHLAVMRRVGVPRWSNSDLQMFDRLLMEKYETFPLSEHD
jgi:hypothetical protein